MYWVINQIELENFKCFKKLKLNLKQLTLLSGSNASGKSSVLQSLVLLSQTMKRDRWSKKLFLNGSIIELGTVQDIVNKVHGRQKFSLSLDHDYHKYSWEFSGERDEMSMEVKYLSETKRKPKDYLPLSYLMPTTESQSIATTLCGSSYLTAERIGPKSFYPIADNPDEFSVGPKGEDAISILHRTGDEHILEPLRVLNIPPTVNRQVEAWMRKFFPGFGMDVSPIDRMNAVTLGIRTADETDYHRPINVGFGLTQVLPIIIAVLSAKPDSLIMIENPEVHLHPAGQAQMGEFLAKAASAGVQIIIETHSDHVLNGIRRSVRNSTLEPEQVALHFFRQPSEELDQVESPFLDKSGNLDSWPEGFFDQYDKDMNYFAGWGK
jgi:predicted ATPase